MLNNCKDKARKGRHSLEGTFGNVVESNAVGEWK
jgi:hypothetical protein